MPTALVTALMTAQAAQARPTEGAVRNIDHATSLITLRHAEINSQDMPAMTMAFREHDTQVPNTLAMNDKRRFELEKLNGEFNLTQIGKVS